VANTERWSKDLTAPFYEPPIQVGEVVVIPVEGGLNLVDPATGEVRATSRPSRSPRDPA
jgi:hypothetical protein